MPGRVVRLADGHLVLVSEPTDYWLQAVMSGVLELRDGYLCLRDGGSCDVVLLPEDTEVVVTPSGPVFRMFGAEYAVGDRVTAGGGTIDADSHPVPVGSGLAPDRWVAALQDDGPDPTPRRRRAWRLLSRLRADGRDAPAGRRRGRPAT